MTAIRTARERAREELTREIKLEARRQLASEGAQRLSLRAVARELGMASSAIYRYYPSRDELLTALIVDAYTDLADTADAALAAAPTTPRARWRALCTAVRGWALAHPHEYALVYGTPVPGYRAPQETIEPAARLPLALIAVAREGRPDTPAQDTPAPPAPAGPLGEQLARLRAELAPDLPEAVLARAAIAWTQLFGMIGFELFGHLAGSFDPADAFFAHAVEEMADLVGLPAEV
ncbi:TetR/AcrR family transcriptional regulator [Kitasatospora sp. DSM 101779]|uniref:TetR/AcrR family transcriptional regulator n=1 Tax=Kitasatospora sp. DSM 101779 TaxID=2853165 RepID=UPI0021DB0D57|nr:TetR/AcrR family transcriptional regulator [Kitasatospora sp. DSM 101779]MCU7822331.1 TetR/AcrR family transcriptional regulator [Kitasatospora sp. DSM 101779]